MLFLFERLLTRGGWLINFSPMLHFIQKPVIFVQSKANEGFVYEMHIWVDMGYSKLYSIILMTKGKVRGVFKTQFKIYD